jgi:hypothetical protein
MSTKQIRTGQSQPEPPSPALSRAGPHVGHRGALEKAPRNARIVSASRAGESAQDTAAEHSLSLERIRQIVAAAGDLERSSPEAFDYLGRRTRDLLERQGWMTVQLVRDACLALPGGERLLQVPGFGRKSLREVRRWLWLQTGDPRFEDRDVPDAAGRGRAPGQKVRTSG